MFIDNFGISLGIGMFGPLVLDAGSGFLDSASPGLRAVAIGFLLAAYPLMQFIFAPLIGDIADKFGRRKAFILTLSGLIVGFALSAIAIMMKSYTFLLITRVISGAFSANLAICLAALSDMSPDETSRSRAFGYNSTALGLGWVCAMLLGGYFVTSSPSMAFWITSGLTVISLIAIIVAFKETHVPKDNVRFSLAQGIQDVGEALKISSIRPIYIAYFLWTVGWGNLVSWTPELGLKIFGVSAMATTWALAANGTGWSIGGVWLNPILGRLWNNARYTVVSIVVLIILMSIMSIPYTFLFIGIMMFFASLVASLSMTNILNMISLQAPEDIQGRVMGLAQSGLSLGLVVGPIIGAQIFARAPLMSNIIDTLFVVLSLIFILLGMRRSTPLSLTK